MGTDDVQADLSHFVVHRHTVIWQEAYISSLRVMCVGGVKCMGAYPQYRGRWINFSHIYPIFTLRRPSMTETLLTVPLNLNTNQTKH